MAPRSTETSEAPPTEQAQRKRPAYQWYPGDFKRDTALQACSFEARALWREMLDLMHDGEPYGHLTAGGVAIQDRELARMVGIPPKKCTAWLHELESRAVFSRTDKGVIYSRRMVKDERIRTVRAQSGRLGGNPILLNQPDNLAANQRAEQNPTPAVAVAVATAKPTTGARQEPAEQPTDAIFEEAWAAYPKRPGNSKADSWKQWVARVKAGVDPLDMLEGARRYAKYIEANPPEKRTFIKMAQTFFGPGLHFQSDWTPDAPADPLASRIAQLQAEEDAAIEKTRQLLATRGAA
jgi:hypothetical protein